MLKRFDSQHRRHRKVTDGEGNRRLFIQPSISHFILLQSSKDGERREWVSGSADDLSLDASLRKMVGAKHSSIVGIANRYMHTGSSIPARSHSLSTVSGDATALTTLASAPRTVTPGVSYQPYNLRVFSTPVATAVACWTDLHAHNTYHRRSSQNWPESLMLALSSSFPLRLVNSYFTFVFSMAFNIMREIIGPKLKLRSYLAFRFVVPLAVYAWLSLMLAMVCRHVHICLLYTS